MQNTNIINDLIPDTSKYMINFLDRTDITKMRVVSTNYKRYIDLNQNKLYSHEILNLKSLFYIYNDVKNQLEIYDGLIKEKKLKNTELTSMSSLMITPHYGKRSLVLDTICLFSTTISQNVESFKRNKSSIEIEIERLNIEIKKFDPTTLIIIKGAALANFSMQKLKICRAEIGERNFIKWQKKYETKMIQMGIGPKEKQTIFKTMMNLFGGVQQYEALPVLDLHDREISKDYRGLKLEDLTAPIMRGFTDDGRNFFVMRYSHPINGVDLAVVSQYVKHDYNTWSNMRGGGLIEYTHFINEGVISKEAFDQLAEVIKTRRNGNYSIQ